MSSTQTQCHQSAHHENNKIVFLVNGQQKIVNSNVYPVSTSLNDYLRNTLYLTGTKSMCHEGGCGSCVINGKKFDYTTNKYVDLSIMTCLMPLYLCDQWEFTTVEGIGSKKSGFHEIQKRIIDHNGSQCGFCTPGFVMNMYNLLLNDQKPTKETIENNFDSHICRCTGYRSILTAMKSFASDEQPIDIEELNKLACLNNGSCCGTKESSLEFSMGTQKWYVPTKLDEFYNILKSHSKMRLRIVGGNTGIGIYKADGPFDAFVSTQKLKELHEIHETSSLITIGSAVTITQLIDIFENASIKHEHFKYLNVLALHLRKVANKSIRNMGTWSGNLGLKKNHLDFDSDLFLCFKSVDAKLNIFNVNHEGSHLKEVTLDQYLELPSNQINFIHSIKFHKIDTTNVAFKTYKIMPRSQNSHPYVNAAFRFELDKSNYVVKSKPTILIGGMKNLHLNVDHVENCLVGKSLCDQSFMNDTFKLLYCELEPDENPVFDKQYKRNLGVSLFYKFVLTVCQDKVASTYKSGADLIKDLRQVSNGVNEMAVIPEMYPLTEPSIRFNGYLNASGETKYAFDTSSSDGQLIGEFIGANIASGKIDNIDIEEASKMPGVVKIILAKDIPGVNCVCGTDNEQLFADNEISFYNQPIGLVVANTLKDAKKAAKCVKVTYKDIKKPIITIHDGIKANSYHNYPNSYDMVYGNSKDAIESAPNVIEGKMDLGPQCHFYMEPLVAVCRPTEDGYKVDCGTQFIDSTQFGVAKVLGVEKVSCIDMEVKQIGGAFGGKITRTSIVANAAAVGAYHTKKPVRVCLDLKTNFRTIAKRCPWYIEYKVGFDNNGKLLGVELKWYVDEGHMPLASVLFMISPFPFFDNTYSCPNWTINIKSVKTNLPVNTSMRSPDYFFSIASIDFIMEDIARYLKINPYAVKMLNLYKNDEITPYNHKLSHNVADMLMQKLYETSNYKKRYEEIVEFNKNNRWKKRGISLMPLRCSAFLSFGLYSAFVSIYHSDGSIAVSHGGIEMGQGIHTRVVQAVSYLLKVDKELISVKSSNALVSPNQSPSGGSITTEIVCECITECCRKLNEELEPVRKVMPENYTWKELIAKAYQMNVDLCARHLFKPDRTNPDPISYDVYSAGCTEVLVDVLTGETEVLRADIIYDSGRSLNPLLDLGQIEGGFVQGLGYWFNESFKVNKESGEPVTNGTWEYKVPTTKDIPIDLRVSFLKDSVNPVIKLGSKLVSEPPIILSASALEAAKSAVLAARLDIGNDKHFDLDAPATPEILHRATLVDYTQFKLV